MYKNYSTDLHLLLRHTVIVVLGVGQGQGGHSQNEESHQEDSDRSGNLLDYTRDKL